MDIIEYQNSVSTKGRSKPVATKFVEFDIHVQNKSFLQHGSTRGNIQLGLSKVDIFSGKAEL
jgi:hypothetical protein